LDTGTAWRQIEADLTDGQRLRWTDAATDVAFFLNLSLLLWAATGAAIFDQKHRPVTVGWVVLALSCLFGGYLAYRFATRAVETHGSVTKALIDLRHGDVQDPGGSAQPARDATPR
jgi:hypothetical protein